MLSASLLTTTQAFLCLLLCSGALLWGMLRISWVELVADSRRQHLLFGCIFALSILWLMRKEFDNGLTFHFLGMTLVTLMLDWPLALLAPSVQLPGSEVNHAQLWTNWRGDQKLWPVGFYWRGRQLTPALLLRQHLPAVVTTPGSGAA